MKKAEVAAGIVVLAIGLALLAGAWHFPLLLAGVPGPGFLPLIIAIAILTGGAVLVAGTMARKSIASSPAWPARAGWWRVALMLAALAVSFVLLEALGFLIVTTVFMAVMIYCLGERSRGVLIAVPPLSALALYAVFAVWLRVPLPKGLITFIG
jgi:hypothetical protein